MSTENPTRATFAKKRRAPWRPRSTHALLDGIRRLEDAFMPMGGLVLRSTSARIISEGHGPLELPLTATAPEVVEAVAAFRTARSAHAAATLPGPQHTAWTRLLHHLTVSAPSLASGDEPIELNSLTHDGVNAYLGVQNEGASTWVTQPLDPEAELKSLVPAVSRAFRSRDSSLIFVGRRPPRR